MIEIRYVKEQDKEFWYRLDRHLPETEFNKKVRDRQGYILCENGIPKGLLRYGLFWDNTAQHFYRKLGYKDCGGFVLDIPGYEQPMELFFVKAIERKE